MLSSSRFAEESVEGVVAATYGLIRRHLPVRLDAMLQAIELPAGIADLHTSLSDVNRDALTLQNNNRTMN